MLKNYFKIAWRNLAKNRASSFINIGGLAVGMAVAILIGLWIYDEWSFNRYFEHYDRIARVMTKWEMSSRPGSSQPMPLGTELRSSFKDDFSYVVLSTQTEDFIIAAGDKKIKLPGKFMQPEAGELLSLKMRKGTRAGLRDINSILLSESLAQKLFGDADPLDKMIKIDNRMDVKVTGVYEDFPGNTEFKNLAFIAPWDLYTRSNDWVKKKENDWNNIWVNIYTLLAPGADQERVSARIRDLKKPHVGPEEAAAKPAVFLHPMSRWHLYSRWGKAGESVESEQLQYVWFYGVIGLFVLLLACINFMNLSTARSERRAKEVGIRKTMGSLRRQLIYQFYCESLLVAAFSFLLAILLAQLILPWYNEVAGKKMRILWGYPLFWLAGIGFSIVTGLLAGSYPALYLSSFNPVKVLKGRWRAGRLASLPRKILVTVQFTVSVALMIGTIIVYRQIHFAKDRPVGYSREGLLSVPMIAPEFQGKYELLRTELAKTGMVSEIAESASPVTGIWSENGGFDWKGKASGFRDQFGTLCVTHEYGRTIGWQFVAGRDFSKAMATDSAGFVVNEAAVKYMGLSNPVGALMRWDRYTGVGFRILGVVKDMVMESPYAPAMPTIFFLSPDDAKNCLFLRISAGASASRALPAIEAVFKQLVPSAPFDYTFVDEEYASKFAGEERVGKLAGFFAVLAILISCLGLFGLASFVAEQRTKEVGVRKVLGATVFNVWKLLSKDFVVLVVLSCLIAIPIAYYCLQQWLGKYEYRTALSWWIFAGTALGALGITLLTVSYQAIRAATANPVNSLRAE
ncbi:MAG TPA: ABC transporter permease [Puia sp.]|nr:ABC transporter permease [Puia sp.]